MTIITTEPKRQPLTKWGACKWCARILFRHRKFLAPIYISLTAATAGTLGYLLEWRPWIPAVAGVILAGVFGGLGPYVSPRCKGVIRWLVPDGLDDGRKGVLDRVPERIYLSAVLLSIGTWLSLITAYGWSDPLLKAWAIGSLLLALPWWVHHRIRKPKGIWAWRWRHVAQTLKEFQESSCVKSVKTNDVTILTVVLRPGQTIEKVGGLAAAVNSAMSSKLRSGAVMLGPGNADRRITVTVVPRDPWVAAIPHPGLLLPVGTSRLNGPDPLRETGLYADQTPHLHKFTQHHLIIGQTDSGKSSHLDTLITHIALDADVAGIVASDLARVTLVDWEPLLAAPLARTPDQALDLAQRVLSVIEAREQWMEQHRHRVWPGKHLFHFTDELPTLNRLNPKAIELYTINAERARKAKVWLYLLAQNGSKADIGSTELRAQMQCTIVLRVDRHMNNLVWGAEYAKQGWDSTNLAQGTFLLRDPKHDKPRVTKGVYIGDAGPDPIVSRILAHQAANPEHLKLDTVTAGALTAERALQATAEVVNITRTNQRPDGRRKQSSQDDAAVAAAFDRQPEWRRNKLEAELGFNYAQLDRSLERLKGTLIENTGGYGIWRKINQSEVA